MQFSLAGRPYRLIRSIYLCGWFFFCFTCLCFNCSCSSTISEKSVLLEIKSSVSDSSGALSTWISTNSSDHLEHCSWNGVVCNGPDSRVSALTIASGGGFGGKFEGKNVPCFDVLKLPFYGFGIRRACLARNGKLIGKLPSVIAKLTEIRVLSFPFHGFSGEIPDEFWGLENLEVLDLEGNSLTGNLPPSIPGLAKLRVLNLGLNEIGGDISISLSKCVRLEVLNLAGNRFRGSIPSFIGTYPKLSGLYLSYNSLEGDIPSELASYCENLEYLDLSGNALVGRIPQSLGNCLRLRALLLSSNQLRGFIPSTIGQLKKLEVLDVSRNHLSGLIPRELGDCADLSVLVLSNLYSSIQGGNVSSENNSFGGSIPTKITSLAKLRVLWAPSVSLKGEIPSNWGGCDSLEVINLSQNFLTGGIKGAFRGCKNLIYVDLSSNKLTGQLDEEFLVPCMVVFDVSRNLLSGDIPRFRKGFCRPLPAWVSESGQLYGPTSSYLSFFARFGVPSLNLRLVAVHNFGCNNFTGDIHSLPVTTSHAGRKTDYAFLANGNKLTGSFPWHLFNVCYKVNALFVKISDNRFSGQIPIGISGMCKSLKYLDASGNQISGVIFRNVENVPSIVFLDMNQKKLENARIPIDIGRLNHLYFFSMSTNKFRGALPLSWRQLLHVDLLSYSSSPLAVKLLPDTVRLKKLTALVFHKNQFLGELHSSLSSDATHLDHSRRLLLTDFINCTNALGNSSLLSCQMLNHSLSVPYSSFNSSSEVSQHNSSPLSVNGSEYSGGNKFNSIEIASLVSASTIVAVLLALVGVCIYTRKYGQKGGSRVQVLEREITIFNDIGVPLTFQSIVEATECFSTRNCIGSGGFGATYRAELSPGVIVAVKRLAVGRFHGVQQFHAEIKTLGRIKHHNLVTLIGYHASETQMLLIYNYLPGGNLEKFIQDRRTRPVSWKVLHKIALDVAYALAYLHDSCDPRVIHRDVKPSNILLDNDFNAYLSDFGLSRLLGNSETHATTGVEGTFGYLAPEYAMTCRVSEKADVYSYGVVLLELISDKRALDPSFSAHGDGFNIVSWACMLLKQGRAKGVFTAGLWDSGPRDDLVEVLHLAVKCTLDSLTVRPTMKQVVQRLKQLRPLS